MKKNFFKKLALVMALTLAVGSVPATNVEAAAAPKFKSAKATVKVGQTKNYGIANVSAWSVKKIVAGNKKVATVVKSGKTAKITGVAEGKTTVRADLMAYKTKRTMSVRIPVTVKAADVLVIKGEDDTFVAGVNTPYTLTADINGTDAKTEWSVAGEGATVTADGKFTATKAGEYTVTATAGTATATQKVTVKEVVLKSVAQTGANELTFVVLGNTKSILRNDFTVVNTKTNWTVPSADLTVDGTTVYLTTFGNMTDAQEYTVTLDGVTKSFTASDGVVVDLAMESLVVTAEQETGIAVQTLDKNGVVLGTYDVDGTVPVSCVIDPANDGYARGGYLYLAKVGDTAKVTATFHTGKYDEYGKETGNIEKSFTITAVKDATADKFALTILPANIGAPAWDATNFVANNKIKLDSLTDGAIQNNNVYVRIKNARGDMDTAKYYVESSNTSVFLVEKNTGLEDLKNEGVNIYGVNAGTAYLLVKEVETGAVVASLPVEVLGKPVATTIALSQNSFTVTSLAAVSAPSIVLNIKDQYGVKMPVNSADIELEVVKAPAKADAADKGVTWSAITNDVAPSLTVDAGSLANSDYTKNAGVYNYKLHVTVGKKTLTAPITINLIDDSKLTSGSKYQVNMPVTKFDTTVSTISPVSISTVVALDEVKNGVIVDSAVTLSAITVEKVGTGVIAKAVSRDSIEVIATCAAITDSALTSALGTDNGRLTINVTSVSAITSNPSGGSEEVVKCDKLLAPGTYKITLVGEDDKMIGYQTFTVVDTNPTANLVKGTLVLDVDGGDVTNHIKSGAAFDLSYMGIIVPDYDFNSVTNIEYKLVSGGVHVFSVDIDVKVPGTNVYVTVTVPVNATFENTSGIS